MQVTVGFGQFLGGDEQPDCPNLPVLSDEEVTGLLFVDTMLRSVIERAAAPEDIRQSAKNAIAAIQIVGESIVRLDGKIHDLEAEMADLQDQLRQANRRAETLQMILDAEGETTDGVQG